MAEEKKEEQAQDQEVPKPAVEAPVAAVEAPAIQAAAAKEEKPAAVKAERPANCIGCKKSIKKKRWYYRDGNYYCTKRCWSTTTKKPAKTEETPAVT